MNSDQMKALTAASTGYEKARRRLRKMVAEIFPIDSAVIFTRHGARLSGTVYAYSEVDSDLLVNGTGSRFIVSPLDAMKVGAK